MVICIAVVCSGGLRPVTSPKRKYPVEKTNGSTGRPVATDRTCCATARLRKLPLTYGTNYGNGSGVRVRQFRKRPYNAILGRGQVADALLTLTNGYANGWHVRVARVGCLCLLTSPPKLFQIDQLAYLHLHKRSGIHAQADPYHARIATLIVIPASPVMADEAPWWLMPKHSHHYATEDDGSLEGGNQEKWPCQCDRRVPRKGASNVQDRLGAKWLEHPPRQPSRAQSQGRSTTGNALFSKTTVVWPLAKMARIGEERSAWPAARLNNAT